MSTESRGSCDPKWHDGERVDATMLVMTADADSEGTTRPVLVGLTGPMVRFACCDEHIGQAVVALQDAGGERFIVRRI